MILEGLRLIAGSTMDVEVVKKAESSSARQERRAFEPAQQVLGNMSDKNHTTDQTFDLSIQRTTIRLVSTNTRRSREITPENGHRAPGAHEQLLQDFLLGQIRAIMYFDQLTHPLPQFGPTPRSGAWSAEQTVGTLMAQAKLIKPSGMLPHGKPCVSTNHRLPLSNISKTPSHNPP